MVIEVIGSALKVDRLRWFGHLERKEKEDWVGEEIHAYEGW